MMMNTSEGLGAAMESGKVCGGEECCLTFVCCVCLCFYLVGLLIWSWYITMMTWSSLHRTYTSEAGLELASVYLPLYHECWNYGLYPGDM